MKKYRFLSLLILIASACQAQQSQFGIFAGAQATTAKYMNAGVKQPCTNKYGFNLGAGWKIPFDNQLFFSPAAFYSLKGYKVKYNRPGYPPDSFAVDNNTSIHTFELAFLLQYDFGKQPDHFFIKLGPTLDFQLSGKEKYTLTNGSKIDHNMIYSFGEYGHYAANLLLQFGYESKNGFILYGQYSHGLTDLNNADRGPEIRHRVYGISVGKYFQKKSKS